MKEEKTGGIHPPQDLRRIQPVGERIRRRRPGGHHPGGRPPSNRGQPPTPFS
jgi:hypothetical protein